MRTPLLARSALLLGILVLVLPLSALALQFLTDAWWFSGLGLASVFHTQLTAQLLLALAGGAAAAAAVGINFGLAARSGQGGVIDLSGLEEGFSGAGIPMRLPLEEVRPIALLAATSLALIAALSLGSWAGQQWTTLLPLLHAPAFGEADPLLKLDIGFYVFRLPVCELAWTAGLWIVILSALGSLAGHLYAGNLDWTVSGPRAQPPVFLHAALLLAAAFVLAAGAFQLQIWELPSLQRSIAPGAGYTAIHATLPILRALVVLALAAAAACLAAPAFHRLGWTLAAAGALLGVGLAGWIYAGALQRFIVAPNEIEKETPYIRWAIAATRRAFCIDKVTEKEFPASEDLTPADIRRNADTLENVRLWDHAPLLTTYSQLQEIRTYYDFLDVDNDRYRIGGRLRQVMLSPRELNPESLPSRIWINEHLAYTHGYGLCLGPVNEVTREGLPEFFIKDIPPASEPAFSQELKVTRPEIYYGETPAGYAIVRTASKEFDYPSGNKDVYTEYNGESGVPLHGLLRRLVFAFEFGEPKILFSTDLQADSKILYVRNVHRRLEKIAPFLRWDPDVYLVLTQEGRLVWMADAYTASDSYPYSELVPDLGNYMRNSVKATVDAYDGTVRFYIADPADPIIRAWSGVFPELFHPFSEMPADLAAHIRYPTGLFSVQAQIYSLFHMDDPRVFYNREDLWRVARRQIEGQRQTLEPYTTIMKLAEVGQQEEFILMVPFTPSKKENMIAWMAARNDAPHYGELLVYNFPKQKLVYGPSQIENRIDQDPDISKQLTLWNQGGSKVIRGSLLVIPVESSILYIQPLYLAAEGGGLPELKRVIVVYGNSIAMEETLQDSLNSLFGAGGAAPRRTPSPENAPASLIRQAEQRYERAQGALRNGDWAGYGRETEALGRLLRQLAK